MVARKKAVSVEEFVQPVSTKAVVAKRLSEPTTWAGLLSLAAIISTQGVAALAQPNVLMQAAAGIALVFSKEP